MNDNPLLQNLPTAAAAPAAAAAPSLFSPRDSQLVSKYLIGGAAGGASIGLITSLLNYLGSIKEEKEMADSSKDDDTLYLNLRPKNKGVKRASVAGAAAISGGALSALGSYAIIHALYQKMKRKELQKQLDAEQQGYLDVLDQSKEAGLLQMPAVAPEPQGERMKLPEALLSMPGALAVLLGLASGTVTNKILEKTFPTPKPPGRRNPRRVVIRSADEDGQKVACVQDTDETEFLIRTLMATKSAALDAFKDVICAITDGRHDEMASALVGLGSDTMHDMAKGASLTPQAEPYFSMGIGIGAMSPVLSPSLELLAAAEFQEHYPTYTKWARALPDYMKDAFCKIAGIMAIGIRSDEGAEFSAALDTEGLDKVSGMGGFMLFDALKDALVLNKLSQGQQPVPQAAHGEPGGEEALQEDMNSGGSEDTTGDANPAGTKVIPTDKKSQDFENQHHDVIDAALAA